MTVAQLIDRLSTFPPLAPVTVQDNDRQIDALRPDDIEFDTESGMVLIIIDTLIDGFDV